MTLITGSITLIAIALIAIALWSYIAERKRMAPLQRINSTKGYVVRAVEQKNQDWENLFTIPRAKEDTTPKYAIIDIQTTGLCTIEDKEDRIVELTWLILDSEYNEIRRGVRRVLQKTTGSEDAKRVHHISEATLMTTGEEEKVVLQAFWKDVSEVPIWVFHNAKFDLSILHAAFRDLLPSLESELLNHTALCTMTYLTADKSRDNQYPSLINLTSSFYPSSAIHLRQSHIISFRNACLTRACLIKLLALYPQLLAANYPLSASDHLKQ